MIHYEVGDDRVGRITLDRPEARNALTVEMRDDLVSSVRQARADDRVRSLLLTGVGDSFCAGMDLRAATVSRAGAAGFDPRSTSEALRLGVQALVRELWELDKPSVAAVNGTAVGPGAHIALACDFVLVHAGTRFVWSFARWGLVVDAGGAYLLPRLVGLPRAKAMVLLGEEVQGDTAVQAGLAYRCLGSNAELATAAEELAVRLAQGPTRSLGLSKQLLNASFETALPAALDREAQAQSLAAVSPEMAEGMAAFKDKRPPNFASAGAD
ncbi:MAG TPA: enoyl-CoA hydratase-related protein [Acidimicrobiales bacterium]|nr:enoyl-CoA hydratase-related protein [Acidimicrobiales bacterium]